MAREKPEEITPAQAKEILLDLAGKGKSPATVKGYQRSLPGLYERAGLTNSFPKLKTPLAQRESLLYFFPDQITKLKKELEKEPYQLYRKGDLLIIIWEIEVSQSYSATRIEYL